MKVKEIFSFVLEAIELLFNERASSVIIERLREIHYPSSLEVITAVGVDDNVVPPTAIFVAAAFDCIGSFKHPSK